MQEILLPRLGAENAVPRPTLATFPKDRASDSRGWTPLQMGTFHMKETAWLVCGLKVAVLEKNMRPAWKVCNAL